MRAAVLHERMAPDARSGPSAHTTNGGGVATSDPQSGDRLRILGALSAFHAAMCDARTADLEVLTDATFSFEPTRGVVLERGDWLGRIGSGELRYDRIFVDEDALSVSIAGNTAVVIGRGVFRATIDNRKDSWSLQFAMSFARRDDRWVVQSVAYTGV